MQPEALDEARDWLERAHRDLEAGSRVMAGSNPLPDVAVYHAQQAAEKALKGFLAAHDQPFPKTHDLEPLVLACGETDPKYSQFALAARTLTPYATQYRYPGGPLEPALEEAETALELALSIVQTVEEDLRL